MSDDPNQADVSERLARLEAGASGSPVSSQRRSPLIALMVVVLIGLAGTVFYLLNQPEEEVVLPTATPDEFQPEGEGFGAIEPFVPPEPEVRVVEAEPEPVEPNAELLAQIAALQAQIEAIQNAPEPVVEEDTAADAMNALTAQLAALQEASEAAQEQFAEELAARDRELQELRMDLDLARLEAQTPAPAPSGPSEEELRLREEERLRREEEARRLAELQARAEEERAFQERRIQSPTIAFGGSTGGLGADGAELAERTFGDVTDFVLNGALPSAVTQAEVIANPSNTVMQGTVIQAALETAISSELAGQVRAITSENVYSYDGTRLLIPAGSRLIGRYRSGADIAQSRLTIAWDRIIMPNNQTVVISSFGADELGRSGTTGFVDTRFAERFGSAALISLISAAPSVAANQTEDEIAEDVLEDIGDDLADATDSVIGEYLSIGPVIYVDQGARITVMVDRDLEIF